ncbi:enoyl-CoA hydratase/isomerase family protein [Streptomyces sp. NPDC002092]
MGGTSDGSLHGHLTLRQALNDISNTVREIGQRLDRKKRARQYIRHIRSAERTDERSGTFPAPWPGSCEITKAFCAGGDIRTIREYGLAGDAEASQRFFASEYRFNALARPDLLSRAPQCGTDPPRAGW